MSRRVEAARTRVALLQAPHHEERRRRVLLPARLSRPGNPAPDRRISNAIAISRGVARTQRRSVDLGLSAPAFAFWRCPLSHVDCYVLFARRDDGRTNVARRWRQIVHDARLERIAR